MFTVGELRAELALYPDDAIVEVHVRHPAGYGYRVLAINHAGYGPGVVPDPEIMTRCYL